MALDPSGHSLPAGHTVHVLRVVTPPPPVCEPGGHVSQILAPTSAHFLSSPQSLHVELPPVANLPAAHEDTDPEASHVTPLGHTEHEVRVFSSVPPVVREPAGQLRQVLAPPVMGLYRCAAPQGRHWSLPLGL